jgi:hypothetical protein
MEKILKKNIEVSHEDERRSLVDVFNNNRDIENFKAEHCKILRIKTDCVLGGVWHDYREVIYILQGQAVIESEDIETKERNTLELNERDRIVIEKRTAHRIKAKAETIIIELWEKPYVSDEVNNQRYEMK